MKIIIKQKFSKLKTIYEDDKEVVKPFFDVFFDIETSEGVWIDKDNAGFFPIEVEDKGQSDDELKKDCSDWIVKNNVLAHYKPVNREETLIKEKMRELAIKELVKEGKLNARLQAGR